MKDGKFVVMAGLGGIWNAQAVPGSRTTLFAVAATAVLLAVVAVGSDKGMKAEIDDTFEML